MATTDLANVKWSPDSTSIAVWDAALDYLLLLYSPDGRLLHRYQAYEGGLGIKAVSWSPGGQLLAAGSFDQRCRVLNHVTWRAFAELAHPGLVRLPASTAVYKEVEELTGHPEGSGFAGNYSGIGGSRSGEKGESTSSWWATDVEGGPIEDPAASALRASQA